MKSTSSVAAEKQVEDVKNKNIFVEILETCFAVISAFCVSFWRLFVYAPRKSIRGENVLVTGSGSGIGRQLSVEFCRLGAIVVLWDVNQEANEETAEIIHSEGGECHVYTCDVGSREQIYDVANRVKQEVGSISMLVNNAGIVNGKKFVDCTDEMIERIFNVNLLAHFWTTKAFLPDMLKRNHGHIVNMSSSCGIIGIKKLTDYSATKFGVVGFTEVLNYEIVFSGYTGVHTTLICPMWVKTGMFEGCSLRFPRFSPPLEVGATVDGIMQGILTNQHTICLPRKVYFFSVMKTLLPTEAMLEVLRFMGLPTFMNKFIGHHTEPILPRTD